MNKENSAIIKINKEIFIDNLTLLELGDEKQRVTLWERFEQCVAILPTHQLSIYKFLIIYGIHILKKDVPFSNEKIEVAISESTENGYIWGIDKKTRSKLIQKLEKAEIDTLLIASKLNMESSLYPDFSHIKRILENTPVKSKTDLKKILTAGNTYCDQYVNYYDFFAKCGKGTQESGEPLSLGKMLNVLLDDQGAAMAMTRLYERKRKNQK
ncbi:hypothetical protein [Marinomonas sp.]|uniref:hypothetical protein n=1 Tax=Marinomonas sp. TaxID=1904862 RepID=UPI003BAAA885